MRFRRRLRVFPISRRRVVGRVRRWGRLGIGSIRGAHVISRSSGPFIGSARLSASRKRSWKDRVRDAAAVAFYVGAGGALTRASYQNQYVDGYLP